MNKMNSLISGLSLLTILSIGSCKDFDEVNTNPTVASKDQVRTEYLINQAMITAQQDPHIAERAFVRYWKNAGHQQREGSLTIGATNNDWSTDYYSRMTTKSLNPLRDNTTRSGSCLACVHALRAL